MKEEKVDEEPLILEEIHEQKKEVKEITKHSTETKVSPAARKMASEAKINLHAEIQAKIHIEVVEEDRKKS